MADTKISKLSKSRNWALGRIKGMVVSTEGLTKEETAIVTTIAVLRKQLEDNWEANSLKQGLALERYLVKDQYGIHLVNRQTVREHYKDESSFYSIDKYCITTLEELDKLKKQTYSII